VTAVIAIAGGVTGYVLGSLPVGLLVGRAAGVGDIRAYGSGKTGFTNALRTLGLKWALLVIIGDFAKGAVPVLI
jgi:glycerol-3-phosphate acyltransferase PlsY